jgi:hypothetical protein
MPFDKLLSFGLTLFWCVASLVGFFLLKWDLGETIIFVNLGFISFFLNYLLLFSFLSFKEYLIVAPGREKKGSGRVVYRFIVGIVQHTWNQFLLCCAFLILSGISLVFIGLYFNIVNVNLFNTDLSEMSGSFLWSSLAGLAFTVVEFFRFFRLFGQHRTDRRKVFDWDALKIFHENHRKKLYMYYFGSIVAIIVDSVLHERDANMGMVCLIWLFILNAYWGFVDFRFPIGRKRTVAEEEV